MTMRKFEAVLDILKLNYSVLYIDPDVAILEDPMPYMQFKNIDYVFSMDMMCPEGVNWDITKGGNTGLYFVRPSQSSIEMWEGLVYKLNSL